jgi:transposase
MYVICTSVEPTILTAEATVVTYKDLSIIERVFRILKLVDLQVRPSRFLLHRNDQDYNEHT